MSTTTGQTPGPITLAELSRRDGRTAVDAAVGKVLAGAGVLAIVISLLIVFALVRDAAAFLTDVDLGKLTGDVWRPRSDAYGMMAPLSGTLWVTLVATLLAGPVGLGAAVYLSEYARPRVRATLKPILEVLAGIPSVVLGVFALNWIAPEVVGRFFGESEGRSGSMLAAGIGVGILTIPLMASVSEDAMRSVPVSLREASAGLGARRVSTTLRVVLPAAVSGIVAAFILAASRAIGETMVVFIAGGAADSARFATNPLDGSLTMTAAMASLATGTENVRGAGLAVPSLYFVGIVLFFLTLGLNVIANRFVRRVRQAY
jgi:phosphate transport system permease protein